MSDDLINCIFESCGALFILANCRQILTDRKLRGVKVSPFFFFFTWGLWNLYYYPSLGQWFSFAGGSLISIAYTLFLSLLLYYRKN